MPNEEILKYIKDSLSQNYTKDQISQSLHDAGWGNDQVEEAFRSVQSSPGGTPTQPQGQGFSGISSNYAPEQAKTQSATPKSMLPMAIIAGVVLVATGIGATFWVLTKKDTTPSLLPTEQALFPEATTTGQNPQVEQQVEVLAATSSIQKSGAATPSSQVLKSEIDRYGVDLYKLKQGVTTVEKKIDGESTKIAYTRSKNEIERKVVTLGSDGGKGTLTSTIDLDFKEKLLAIIKEMETHANTDCKNVSTKDCTDNKIALEGLKTICAPLKTNEDMGMCMVAVVMDTAIKSQTSDASSPKSSIDQHGTDLAKLNEGKTVKVFKNPATSEVPYGNETTVTYDRTGDVVNISTYILYDGGRGHVEYKTTISSLKQFLGK